MSKKKQPVAVEPGPKPLVITPQVIVCLQPTGELILEQSNQSPTRKRTVLTQDNIYNLLLAVLCEKQAEIEAERQAGLAAQRKAKRAKPQPDWWLIAKHPEAIIIERLATRSPELRSNKAELSLEEMGI